jgi:hypothetical protein
LLYRSAARWFALAALLTVSCATLNQLRAFVQPPRFEEADGHPAEWKLVSPTASLPAGGATVRLWAKVTNPNPFGMTLGTLRGDLFLEGARAAAADFPLGLLLGARQESVLPIELSISFADLPNLGSAIRRSFDSRRVRYRLDGTIGVDAGPLGQPVFGPMTWLSGELRGLAATQRGCIAGRMQPHLHHGLLGSNGFEFSYGAVPGFGTRRTIRPPTRIQPTVPSASRMISARAPFCGPSTAMSRSGA